MWRELGSKLDRWVALGADSDLVHALRYGVVPEFHYPPAPYDYGELILEGDQLAAWLELRQHYLDIEAIRVVDKLEYCNYAFMVPKNSGGFRLCVDMRPSNSCGPDYPTVYDHLYTLSDALEHGDLLSCFDLADGYFHMFIHPAYQKFFGFKINGVCYEMIALPFGWSGSPAWFMRFSRQIGSWLAAPPAIQVDGEMLTSAPIRHRIFLDDFMLMFRPGSNAEKSVRYVRGLLKYLGLTANEKKSSWELETRKMHLGLWVDTSKGRFEIPEERIDRIKACAKHVLSEVCSGARLVPAKLVAKLAGLSVCVTLAFSGAKLFARELYSSLRGKGSWAAKVKLSNQAVKDVKQLAAFPRRWNGCPIWEPPASRVVITDASDVGWGAQVVVGNRVQEYQGKWSLGWQRQHIMVRELGAVRFALRAALPDVKNQVVESVVDNSAVFYGVRHWATSSVPLMRLLRKIFWLCDRHNITLLPRLVKSEANAADSLSRFEQDAEWCLDQKVFAAVESWFGPHTVDLFAAPDNAKLPKFYSMLGGAGAAGANALLQCWDGENAYCVPPWGLIPKVLKKISSSSMSCTVIVPDLPTAGWFGPLLTKAVCVRPLPCGALYRYSSTGQKIRGKWPLLAVRLQGALRPP